MHAPPNYKSTDALARQYLEKVTEQLQVRHPATASHQRHDHDYDDDDDDDYDEYDEYNDYCQSSKPVSYPLSDSQIRSESQSRTITINLDTSISIHGDGNTIAVASNSNSNSNSSTGQSQSQSQTPSSPNRNSKLANTTAAIVAALKQSGVLSQHTDSDSNSNSSSESRSASPNLEINIDAGVKVKGSRNVVCFGAVVGSSGDGSRKRSAQSEPLAGESEGKRFKRL